MRAVVLLLCAALPALGRLASAGENRRLAFATPALPAASPSDVAHAGGRRAPLRFHMTGTVPGSASPEIGTEDDVPVLRLIALKEGASAQNARRDGGGGSGASSIGRRPDPSILRCPAPPAHVFCRRPLHALLLAARTRHAAYARSRTRALVCALISFDGRATLHARPQLR